MASVRTRPAAAPLLERVRNAAFRTRTAVADAGGSWSYAELNAEAETLARQFREAAGDLAGERAAYLAPPGRSHVAAQLAAWTAGAAAVPLALSHPLPELEHVLDDADPRLVAADPALPQAAALLQAARRRGAATLPLATTPPSPSGVLRTPLEPTASPAADRDASPSRAGPRIPPAPTASPVAGKESRAPGATPALPGGAFIVYTSGTTGRPKGVLLAHRNLTAQVRSLVHAWAWTSEDRILHVLPLHHVHGLVNALCCALWSGAACEFASARPAAGVWERWADGGVTVFMAVPTVYARLVGEWEQAPAPVRRRWSRGAAALRLMVSGSAALPVSVFERWQAASGHDLLERYGMTETGMTLSNPLAGPRRPGHVGRALPGVEVRLAGDDGRVVPEGQPGEIQVRGPSVFSQYWRRPRETAEAFAGDWFRTGDLARVEDGGYRILGRRGTDVFKTGGYRVSALEVEETYRTHPGVRDVAVASVADAEWGDRLCAAYVPEDREAREGPGRAAAATADELRAWGKERLAPYKVPRAFAPVRELPRTAMGKVRRAAVARLFGPRDDRRRRRTASHAGPGETNPPSGAPSRPPPPLRQAESP